MMVAESENAIPNHTTIAESFATLCRNNLPLFPFNAFHPRTSSVLAEPSSRSRADRIEWCLFVPACCSR